MNQAFFRSRWFLCRTLLLMATILALSSQVSFAEGLIVISDPIAAQGHFAFAPLGINYHRVTVDIADQVAVTRVDEEFHNPNGRILEGTYIFPLPAGAHIDHFEMDINGKPAEAELMDADKARKYYEDTVRQYRDPALLEYAGRGAVRVHIFPIEANGNKHIKLQYTQALQSDGGLVEYVYPLGTEKFSSVLLNDVSVAVRITGSDPIKSIYCPTHATEIKRQGETAASIRYSEVNARPDTDFKLLYSTSKTEVGANLLGYRQNGEDGYFMLLASPGLNATQKVQSKDLCFVLDTSGSMSESNKMEQAKKALIYCLANLNPDDHFQVIRFSTDVEPLFSGLMPADDSHLSQARQFVAGLKPTGATALNDAMVKALATHQGGDRPYNVVFLTDGMPTVGESNDDRIVSNATQLDNNARVFCFGIGSDVNTHLLDGIANATRGTSTYVSGDEDIEVKVSNFFNKVREPVLTNVSVAFEGDGIKTSEIYPAVMPDLFKGESITIFGRYAGSGPGSVKITGFVNGEKREFATDVNFTADNTEHGFVPQLWATRRVGWLLDQIRLNGESAELKDEIVSLSRRYGIVTPYTAYLIIEDEQRRNVPLSMQTFSEMQKDEQALANSTRYYGSSKAEATDGAQQTGKQAVVNASAMAGMKRMENLAVDGDDEMHGVNAPLAKAATQPGVAGRVAGYRQTTNYAQQARVVNGRAFYQNNGIWTDGSLQTTQNLKQMQIKVGDPHYFQLLKDHPEVAPWLSLGTQVDLAIGDTLVSVR